jgi:hypothetical protein
MLKHTSTSNYVFFKTFLLLALFVIHPEANSITVSNFTELMSAVNNTSPGDTILMRDGTYTVNNGYGAQIRKNNIVIKSLSNNRNSVIVTGGGMSGGSNYGFWVPGHNVTIQSITIQEVTNHCIQTDVDNHKLRVIDCVLRNGYEQLLKVPAGSGMSDSGLVEGCLFEFTKGVAENYYTGGIDCHRSKDWIVRNNTFKNIRSPGGSIAEHAIHFWNNCENISVENNLIIDCDRGIGFGMGNEKVHTGGIVRNNMIFHRSISGTDFGDVGIGLEYCTDVQVYNNTIFFNNDYSNAIECRFSGSQRNAIINNLTNKRIQLRDGASASLTSNISDAQAEWFVSPSNGDLHLASGTIVSVVDKGTSINGLFADYDNNPRPQGTGIDIGADEYASTKVNYVKIHSSKPSTSSHYQLKIPYRQNGTGNRSVEASNQLLIRRFSLNGSLISPAAYHSSVIENINK